MQQIRVNVQQLLETLVTNRNNHKKHYEMTCSACPEQYDAYLNGSQVGYLRLRHGGFRVDFPNCGSDCIYYSEEVNGDGTFDDSERDKFLLIAKQAILGALYARDLHAL